MADAKRDVLTGRVLEVLQDTHGDSMATENLSEIARRIVEIDDIESLSKQLGEMTTSRDDAKSELEGLNKDYGILLGEKTEIESDLSRLRKQSAALVEAAYMVDRHLTIEMVPAHALVHFRDALAPFAETEAGEPAIQSFYATPKPPFSATNLSCGCVWHANINKWHYCQPHADQTNDGNPYSPGPKETTATAPRPDGARVWKDNDGTAWILRGGCSWRFSFGDFVPHVIDGTCLPGHIARGCYGHRVELFGPDRDAIIEKAFGKGGIPGHVAKMASTEGMASVPPDSPTLAQPTIPVQQEMLGNALRDLLVKIGMIRADAAPTGPELIMFSEQFQAGNITPPPADAGTGGVVLECTGPLSDARTCPLHGPAIRGEVTPTTAPPLSETRVREIVLETNISAAQHTGGFLACCVKELAALKSESKAAELRAAIAAKKMCACGNPAVMVDSKSGIPFCRQHAPHPRDCQCRQCQIVPGIPTATIEVREAKADAGMGKDAGIREEETPKDDPQEN